MKNIRPLTLLSHVVIILGLIIGMVPENTTLPYKLTAEEMLEEVQEGTEYIHPDELAEWLINKDPLIQLIDVRLPEEYETYHLPAAINIPFHSILSDEWVNYLDQDIKMNILYSNGTPRAHEAWMILRQLGFENNYVLQGGLNYWAETILNPGKPPLTSPDDEIAKYNFRKSAGMVFGGTPVTTSSTHKSSSPKPAIKRKKKKKAPEGGC